jgi:hypothetical protein
MLRLLATPKTTPTFPSNSLPFIRASISARNTRRNQEMNFWKYFWLAGAVA